MAARIRIAKRVNRNSVSSLSTSRVIPPNLSYELILSHTVIR